MRSRTTKTPKKVEAAAKMLGVSPEAFLIHSDQYRASNFHVVATSIGNAFYETLEDDDGNLMYKFQPTEEGQKFIDMLKPSSHTEAALQEFVYDKVYLTTSSNLAVSTESGVVCGKRDCPDKHSCGFIPNYPLINFGNVQELPSNIIPSPKNRWVEIEQAQLFFNELLERI